MKELSFDEMEVLEGANDLNCYLGMAAIGAGVFGGMAALLSGPAAPFAGMAAGLTYASGVALVADGCDFSK